MTKKQIKDIIIKTVQDLQKKLRLERYDLIVRFDDNNTEGPNNLANVSADTSYLNATLTFSTSVVIEEYKKFGVRTIKETVLHELIHVILWDLRMIAQARYVSENDFEHFDEQATEHLTKLFSEFIYGNKEKTHRVR